MLSTFIDASRVQVLATPDDPVDLGFRPVHHEDDSCHIVSGALAQRLLHQRLSAHLGSLLVYGVPLRTDLRTPCKYCALQTWTANHALAQRLPHHHLCARLESFLVHVFLCART